jgi:HK97 family phage major capsid protein
MTNLDHLGGEALLARGLPAVQLAPDGEPRDVLDRVTSRALSLVNSQHARQRLTDDAAVRLERLIRRDRTGETARYVQVAADDAYERAFAKILGDPRYAHLQLTDRERDAVSLAAAIDTGGTPGGVGYVLPLTIDPTVNVTNDGALNPLRGISRTVTVVGNTWQGINSDGVTAAYEPELTEVGDSTPAFEAPSAKLEKAQAYIEFSIEVAEDWPQASAELGKLLADAKDRLEAEKFLTGTGTDEPLGLLTSLDAAGPPVVQDSNGISADAVYDLRGDLGSRYQPRAGWLGHPVAFDQIRRLAGPGSEEPPLLTSDAPLQVLRRAAYEASAMPNPVTAVSGDIVMVYGDFSQLLLLDKLGLRVELIPHVLGANRRPIAARALYAYWRSTSLVLNANAFRALARIGS